MHGLHGGHGLSLSLSLSPSPSLSLSLSPTLTQLHVPNPYRVAGHWSFDTLITLLIVLSSAMLALEEPNATKEMPDPTLTLPSPDPSPSPTLQT